MAWPPGRAGRRFRKGGWLRPPAGGRSHHTHQWGQPPLAAAAGRRGAAPARAARAPRAPRRRPGVPAQLCRFAAASRRRRPRPSAAAAVAGGTAGCASRPWRWPWAAAVAPVVGGAGGGGRWGGPQRGGGDRRAGSAPPAAAAVPPRPPSRGDRQRGALPYSTGRRQHPRANSPRIQQRAAAPTRGAAALSPWAHGRSRGPHKQPT